jgi:hypothetical protein
LQRGGNKISSFPPLQGGIKGGKSPTYVCLDIGKFFTRNDLIPKHKMATPFCVFKTLTGFGF